MGYLDVAKLQAENARLKADNGDLRVELHEWNDKLITARAENKRLQGAIIKLVAKVVNLGIESEQLRAEIPEPENDNE